MRILSLTALLAILYALLVILALAFRPVEPVIVTDDWRDAMQHERECEGHTRVEYDQLTREFSVFCKEK